MTKPKPLSPNRFLHPLDIVSWRHWQNLKRIGGGVDKEFILRAAFISFSSPFTAFARFRERFFFGQHVDNTQIVHPPLFILGHWRSGTTHLHNLLAQDPALAYITTFQTLAPDSYLSAYHTLRPLMALSMPKTRPMDNMAIGSDLPQEEEFAVCNTCVHSFYAGWYFPKMMPALFKKYVLFEGISPEEQQEWNTVYHTILKKATFTGQGKRLVIKNPVNTGRIRALLDLYPDARFVHIYRNPFEVYPSTMRLHQSVVEWIGLQRISNDQIRDNVFHFFHDMMQTYLKQRDLIPPENLVEIRYEDFVKNPMEQLEALYRHLRLPGWDAARTPIQRYLDSQAGYQKAPFHIAEEDAQRIEHDWQFALDTWNYQRP